MTVFKLKCVGCGKTWDQHFEFPWLYCYEWGHERFCAASAEDDVQALRKTVYSNGVNFLKHLDEKRKYGKSITCTNDPHIKDFPLCELEVE